MNAIIDVQQVAVSQRTSALIPASTHTPVTNATIGVQRAVVLASTNVFIPGTGHTRVMNAIIDFQQAAILIVTPHGCIRTSVHHPRILSDQYLACTRSCIKVWYVCESKHLEMFSTELAVFANSCCLDNYIYFETVSIFSKSRLKVNHTFS